MAELAEAVAALDDHGVLERLSDLIRQVYRRNADRHEPDLGDDAMSFGTQVWRNLTNLGAAHFDDLDGVTARVGDNSLEILCAGYVVRLYSLQGSVESIRWEGSEARLAGAVENSRDAERTLADAAPDVFAGVLPPKRHVRVAHTGDLTTGEATAYIGLPRDNRDGGSPWFEVELWFGEPRVGLPLPLVTDAPPTDGTVTSGYDELPIPELDIAPHRPGRATGRSTPA
jgi:hypothetical protein